MSSRKANQSRSESKQILAKLWNIKFSEDSWETPSILERQDKASRLQRGDAWAGRATGTGGRADSRMPRPRRRTRGRREGPCRDGHTVPFAAKTKSLHQLPKTISPPPSLFNGKISKSSEHTAFRQNSAFPLLPKSVLHRVPPTR